MKCITSAPLAAFIVAALLIEPAMSQQSAAASTNTTDEPLSEIIVTAQRRAESIQDVPVSVSLVTAAQLDRQQVSQLTDLAKTTASVQFGSVGNSNGAGSGAFIRGIGTAALTRSAESAVGVVVDGVVQGNTNIANLFDIARVEVLRGPQGTLFGQSVSAGVINITTEAPDPSGVSGRVSTELSANDFARSEYGRQVARAALNLPITSDSAVRVSAYGNNTTDVSRNTYTGKDDRFDEYGMRAHYLGNYGALAVNLIADYSHSVEDDGAWYTLIGADPTVAPLAPGFAPILAKCGVTAKLGNMDQCSSFPNRQTSKTGGASAQFDLEFGSGLKLTSISAYRINDLFASVDIDRTPIELAPFIDIGFVGPTDYKQFTQELRLASDPTKLFSYTVGGFYYDARTSASSGLPGEVTIVPFGLTTVTQDANHSLSRNISAFGEAQYHSGPLTVFAGARFNNSKLRTVDRTQGLVSTPTGLIGDPTAPLNTEDNRFSDNSVPWRVGARYKVTDDTMTYATVARGYKNGQALAILSGQATPTGYIDNRIVYPEEPTSYELGVKTSFLDNRLIFDVDGYYQITKNLQTQTFLKQAASAIPALLPTNVSKATSKGFEADLLGRFGHFTVDASAAYTIAKYPDDYFDRNNVSLQGEQIAFAPRFGANLSAEYSAALADRLDGFLSLNLRYRTQMRLADTFRSHEWTVDQARTVVGARAGVRIFGSWSVSIFGDNLTGTRIPSVLFPTLPPGEAAFYTAQSRRLVGLSGQYEF